MNVSLTASRRAESRRFDAPNLNEARERELLAVVRCARSADESRAATTELWMSHGKLVAAIATKYRRSDIDHEDLIAAGHLGLHTAIVRFDASRFDSRLAAYATVWIRWHIHDYIRKNTGPVRLPESKAHRQLAQSGTKLLADARRACDREGVDPTDSELHARVGRRIGLSADEVATGLRLAGGAHASLDAREGEDDSFEALFPDDAAPTADDMNERMDHARLRARLRVLANEILGERERTIFLSRGMADSDDIPSLEHFASQFGVSTARIHQIESSARRKIAAALIRHGYGDAACGDVVAPFSSVRSRRGVRTANHQHGTNGETLALFAAAE